MAARSKPNEIRIERLYDAPVEAVWDAWADPAQAAHWWGPRGFTITTHSKDLRAGGHWDYTMHGPDGTDYPNTTQYLEVEPYRRLVYDHGGHKDRPPLFRVTVTFAEVDGKTRMEMTMALATAEAAAATRKFIKSANGNSTWDRLGEFLAQTLAQKDQFIVNRTFDAPIARLYEMWTDPARLAQWSDAARKVVERTAPTRLVYEQEDSGRAVLTVVTLTEEEPTLTRITVTQEPCGAATAAERETFVATRRARNDGWTATLDKLEDCLASEKTFVPALR